MRYLLPPLLDLPLSICLLFKYLEGGMVQRPPFLPEYKHGVIMEWFKMAFVDGRKLKWSTLFFLPFPPSWIKIYRCRPEKRTGSVRKNTKLEKKGFKVVYRRWRRSYDQYGNILSHRSLKSSWWFFLLFVSFSITIHICRPHGRRAEVRKDV